MSLHLTISTALDTLGLSADASIDDINKAYRRLVLKYHPDKGGKSEDFHKISDAKDYLLENISQLHDFNKMNEHKHSARGSSTAGAKHSHEEYKKKGKGKEKHGHMNPEEETDFSNLFDSLFSSMHRESSHCEGTFSYTFNIASSKNNFTFTKTHSSQQKEPEKMPEKRDILHETNSTLKRIIFEKRTRLHGNEISIVLSQNGFNVPNKVISTLTKRNVIQLVDSSMLGKSGNHLYMSG